MKWRGTLVYLLLFLVVGGYFYYVEVVRKEEKQAAEKAARKIFSIKQEDLKTIEITPKDGNAVLLSKDGSWKILKPVTADVDDVALENYVKALAELTVEREVSPDVKDYGPFGLAEPSLKVRFELGTGQWQEMFLGEKNPLGDGYYARIGESPRVFLVSSGVGEGFFSTATDLRKKELLTFKPDDVVKVRVVLRDGKTVSADKVDRSGGRVWVDSIRPERMLKETKVENLVQQIHWLRAKKFLQEGGADLKAFDLDPPVATLTLGLQNGEVLQLKLGKSESNKKTLTALSSQLPAVVELDSAIYEDIPADVASLEDHSLLSSAADEVSQIKWAYKGVNGQVVRQEKSKWAFMEGDTVTPLKDSWLPQSLLWNMKDLEYEREAPAVGNGTSVPGNQYFLELRGGEKLMLKVSWFESAGGSPEGLELLTLEGNDLHKRVLVKGDEWNRVLSDLGKLEGDLKNKSAEKQK